MCHPIPTDDIISEVNSAVGKIFPVPTSDELMTISAR